MATGIVESIRKREMLISWGTMSEVSIVDVLRLVWYFCWQCPFLRASVNGCESRRWGYRLSGRKSSTKRNEILARQDMVAMVHPKPTGQYAPNKI